MQNLRTPDAVAACAALQAKRHAPNFSSARLAAAASSACAVCSPAAQALAARRDALTSDPDAVAACAGRRAQDYKVNAMRALLAAAVAVLTQALQPTVLVTDGLAPCGLERLAERGAKIEDLNERSLQDALQEADGVIVRSATTLTATLIEQAPSLRCIGRAGVGLDNIDLEAAAKRKIPVVTSAGASTRAVSELCMAHLLQCARGLIQADKAVSNGAFKAFKSTAASCSHELGGKRLGLLGFGRIARVLNQREK